jgi:hypothetical protein
MRRPVLFCRPLALLLAVALCGSVQAQLLRCESPTGAVTYANGSCPAGTTVKREVPPPPPVSDAERQRAQSQAKAEASQARKLEQAERAEAQQRERARAAEEKKAEERARNCRKLALQVQQAEDRVSKATVNKREAAEKQRDRARERYEIDCR